MAGGGAEQVAEAAERVGADRLPLVGGGAEAGEAVLDVDVEVVEPEVDRTSWSWFWAWTARMTLAE